MSSEAQRVLLFILKGLMERGYDFSFYKEQGSRVAIRINKGDLHYCARYSRYELEDMATWDIWWLVAVVEKIEHKFKERY